MLATVIPKEFKLDVHSPKPTTILIDAEIPKVLDHKRGNFMVAFTVEPTAIIGKHIQEYLKLNYGHFDLILTDQPELLGLPNARLFVLGLPWFQNDPIPDKDFSVSTVVGRKAHAAGHKIRHVLWERQDEITVPKRFYRSYYGSPNGFSDNPVLFHDKTPVFTSQFHICIENSFDSPDYFTEKILDCFRMKTVPIYWGATNIGQYFDVRGIIQVNTMDDLITETNSIRENTYKDMLPFVERNYLLSERYIDAGRRVSEMLTL